MKLQYQPTEERPRRKSHLSHKVLKRDRYTCQCCGFKEEKLEVHHIKPHFAGGKEEENNLITLCHTCHRGAPNDPDQFLDYQSRGGAVWIRALGLAVLDAGKGYSVEEIREALTSVRLMVFGTNKDNLDDEPDEALEIDETQPLSEVVQLALF